VKSSSQSTRILIAALSWTLLLCGCASAVEQSYRETPPAPNVSLAPFSGETKVFSTVDPEHDAVRLAGDGFVQVGVASFKAFGHVELDPLRAQARKAGADVILFSERRPRSAVFVQPQMSNADGRAAELNPYVHVGGSLTPFSGSYGDTGSVGGGTMDFKGKVTSSGIPGVSSADMEAMNTPQFECTATFWRKIQLKSVPSKQP
jgi:hypothetical protein